MDSALLLSSYRMSLSPQAPSQCRTWIRTYLPSLRYYNGGIQWRHRGMQEGDATVKIVTGKIIFTLNGVVFTMVASPHNLSFCRLWRAECKCNQGGSLT